MAWHLCARGLDHLVQHSQGFRLARPPNSQHIDGRDGRSQIIHTLLACERLGFIKNPLTQRRRLNTALSVLFPDEDIVKRKRLKRGQAVS